MKALREMPEYPLNRLLIGLRGDLENLLVLGNFGIDHACLEKVPESRREFASGDVEGERRQGTGRRSKYSMCRVRL